MRKKYSRIKSGDIYCCPISNKIILVTKTFNYLGQKYIEYSSSEKMLATYGLYYKTLKNFFVFIGEL